MVQYCIDISRATAYALCASQIFFTVACIMYSPKKEITVYTLKTSTNTTDLSVYETNFHVQGMFGCMSFLAFFFSMQTMSSDENNQYTSIDYTYEFLSQNAMWDMLFWVYCLGSHFLLVGVILRICDVYLLLWSVSLIQYALYKICYPRMDIQTVTRENIYLLGYVVGIWIVFSNAGRQELIFAMTVMDACLGMGHAWDRQATIDTVINCRLAYISCQSFVLCLYYLC